MTVPIGRRTAILSLLVASLLEPVGATEVPAEAPSPLRLEEVMHSVRAQYPLLFAVEEERRIAAGKLQSALGAFDLSFWARSDAKPQGFYESYTGDVGIEQPTTLWGTTFFGGYRIGQGNFAVYDGDRLTRDAGEVRVGIEVPLLRDGAIDPARAAVRRARIDAARAGPEIRGKRIEIARRAKRTYWEWLATGRRVEIAERLLAVAEQRQEQIEGRVARGAVPEIDVADNARLIADRRIKLEAARRDAEQAAIRLSLFVRDADGRPRRVDAARRPRHFPEPMSLRLERLAADIEAALARHPALLALDLLRERTTVEYALARNELLPSLDVKLVGSQDYGAATKSRDKGPAEIGIGVEVELPVQRRKARGRRAALSARLAQIDRERQFAREQLAADIRSAYAALDAASAQLEAARTNHELAERLQRAEQRKLALGASNLIDVNIRELQAADAEAARVDSAARYFVALADYEAAIALDPLGEEPV